MMKDLSLKIIAVFCFLIGWGCLAYFYVTTPSVSKFSSVQKRYRTSDIVFQDSAGRTIHQWRKNKNERVLPWVRLSSVSPTFIEAVLKSEDRNFYDHHGVDYLALVTSFYQRAADSSSRGGSTLSMQLVKMLSSERSLFMGWSGKMRQVLAASRLEQSWNKEEILEAYLNLIPFRGEFKGVASIAFFLFHKEPANLTKRESTLLAVLIRAPNAKLSDWQQRACWQEPEMCTELSKEIKRIESSLSFPMRDQYALHLAQRLSSKFKSGAVRTFLRQDLQLYAKEVVQSHIQSLSGQNVRDAAVLVVENSTGEVWAYLGGSGLQFESTYVDGIQAFRQAGSTLKPFLYATAFENGVINSESWIEDSAVDIVFDRGIYKPQNHDRQFYGWVQVKTALGSSLNVPAIKVFKLLNDTSFYTKLRDLGFKRLQDADYYGPSLVLGAADVTLEDLTQAYRTLAQRGLYAPLRFTSEDPLLEAQRVFSSSSVDEVVKILSDNQNRALGFGLDSSLSVPGTFVKTGTSKDMRDSWCIGSTSRFTVGVWVGNFDGEPMWNVMGVRGAAPIWKKIVEKLQLDYPQDKTHSNEKVFENQLPHDYAEDSVPENYPRARIIYPQDGTVVALDPSIPAKNQLIPLRAQNPSGKRIKWSVNGQIFTANKGALLWAPKVGRHKVELFEEEEAVQEIRIIVK